MPKITPPRNESLRQLRRVVLAAPVHLFLMNATAQKTSCGTAYCAAGWAAIDPWFKERGLSISRRHTFGFFDYKTHYLSKHPFRPLELFFTLSKSDTDNLFGGNLEPDDYVPKEKVIDNIDRLLAGKRALRYRPRKIPSSFQ